MHASLRTGSKSDVAREGSVLIRFKSRLFLPLQICCGFLCRSALLHFLLCCDRSSLRSCAAPPLSPRRGSPEAARQMHDVFALRIWEAHGWRRMGRAGQHFVRGSDASQFAKGVGSLLLR